MTQTEPTESQMRTLLLQIAGLLKDGEEDDDGEIFEMQGDDAYNTLHSVISNARELLGIAVDR